MKTLPLHSSFPYHSLFAQPPPGTVEEWKWISDFQAKTDSTDDPIPRHSFSSKSSESHKTIFGFPCYNILSLKSKIDFLIWYTLMEIWLFGLFYCSKNKKYRYYVLISDPLIYWFWDFLDQKFPTMIFDFSICNKENFDHSLLYVDSIFDSIWLIFADFCLKISIYVYRIIYIRFLNIFLPPSP